MRLTELGIKAAKAQDKPYKLYDEKGLFFISHANRRSTVALQVPARWGGETHFSRDLSRCEAERCKGQTRRSPATRRRERRPQRQAARREVDSGGHILCRGG